MVGKDSEWIQAANRTNSASSSNLNADADPLSRLGGTGTATGISKSSTSSTTSNNRLTDKSKSNSEVKKQPTNRAAASSPSSSTSKPTSSKPKPRSKSKSKPSGGTQTTLLAHLRPKEPSISQKQLSKASGDTSTSKGERKSEPVIRSVDQGKKKRSRDSEPAVQERNGTFWMRDASDDEGEDDDEDEMQVTKDKGKGKERSGACHQENEAMSRDQGKGKQREVENGSEIGMRDSKRFKPNHDNFGSRNQVTSSRNATSHSKSVPQSHDRERKNSLAEESVTEDESGPISNQMYNRPSTSTFKPPPPPQDSYDSSQSQQNQVLSQSQYSLLDWQKKAKPRMGEYRAANGIAPKPEDIPISREERLEIEREDARKAKERSLGRLIPVQGIRVIGRRDEEDREKEMKVEYDHQDTLEELEGEKQYLENGDERMEGEEWDEDEDEEMRLAMERRGEVERLRSIPHGSRNQHQPLEKTSAEPQIQNQGHPSIPYSHLDKRKMGPQNQNTPPHSPLKARLFSLSDKKLSAEKKRLLAPESPSQRNRFSQRDANGLNWPVAKNVISGMGNGGSYTGGGLSIMNANFPEETMRMSMMNQSMNQPRPEDRLPSNHVRFHGEGQPANTSTANQDNSGTSRSKLKSRSRSRSHVDEVEQTPEDAEAFAKKEIKKHLKTLLKRNKVVHSPISGRIIENIETQQISSPNGSEDVLGRMDADEEEEEEEDDDQRDQVQGSDKESKKMDQEILNSPSARKEKRMAQGSRSSPVVRNSSRTQLFAKSALASGSKRGVPASLNRNAFSPTLSRQARPTSSIGEQAQPRHPCQANEARREQEAPNTSQTETESPVKKTRIDSPAGTGMNGANLKERNDEADLVAEAEDDEDELVETHPLAFDSEGEEESDDAGEPLLVPGPLASLRREPPEIVETQIVSPQRSSKGTPNQTIRNGTSTSTSKGTPVRNQMIKNQALSSTSPSTATSLKQRLGIENRSQTTDSPRQSSALDGFEEVTQFWKGHQDRQVSGSSKNNGSKPKDSVPASTSQKQTSLGNYGFSVPKEKDQTTAAAATKSSAHDAMNRIRVPSSQSMAPFSMIGLDLDDELSDGEYGYDVMDGNRNQVVEVAGKEKDSPEASRATNEGKEAGHFSKSKAIHDERIGGGGRERATTANSSRTIKSNRVDLEKGIVYETEGETDNGFSSETQALEWEEDEEDDGSSPIKPSNPQPQIQARPPMQRTSSISVQRPPHGRREPEGGDPPTSDLTPLEDLEKELGGDTQPLAWSDSESEGDQEMEKAESEEEEEDQETQPLPESYDYDEDDEDEMEETQALNPSQIFTPEDEGEFRRTPGTLTRQSAKKLELNSDEASKISRKSSNTPSKNSKKPINQRNLQLIRGGGYSSSSSSDPPSIDDSNPSSSSPPSFASRTKSLGGNQSTKKKSGNSTESSSASGSSQSEFLQSSLPSLNGGQPVSYEKVRKRLA